MIAVIIEVYQVDAINAHGRFVDPSPHLALSPSGLYHLLTLPPAGDYDVRIPVGTSPGDYRLRVGRFEDDSLYDCSGTFSVVSHSPAAYYDSGDEGDFFRNGGGDDEETVGPQSFSYDFYEEFDNDDWRDVSDLEDDSVSDGEEDYDLDDDSVSAGDQVESPPSDMWDWMWSDDGMRGDDDYSQSYDILAPVAADWSP